MRKLFMAVVQPQVVPVVRLVKTAFRGEQVQDWPFGTSPV
jgi:hypothetical protein